MKDFEPCLEECPGYLLAERSGRPGRDMDIQRCDECGRFVDDDEAKRAFVELLLDGDTRAIETALELVRQAALAQERAFQALWKRHARKGDTP